ncbi:MAG TPA: ABC transporter substrate-binding protein [Caldilineaceae bacterium]|nr:ABC transporter substrate-binding protein [Caldilineaceae bacterium]
MLLRKSYVIGVVLFAMLVGCAPVAPPSETTPSETTPSEASGPAGVPTANLADGCVTGYDVAVDYFPDKVTLEQTTGFAVEYHNHYKVVTIKTPWQGATEPLRYALVQCGTPAPEGFTDQEIIQVPVQRFVGMSTTYLPVLEQLGVLDRLVGLDDITYVNNAAVQAMDKAGKLKYIGYGANVNVEQALELEPDLILTYAVGGSDYDAHPKLLEAGLKVVVESSWLDNSPLARTEWIKFIALFFNKEAEATQVFSATADRYTKLAALATAFTDTVYQGTWYMPGGQSYFARYLADAGADFLWAEDTAAGSVPLSFESVFDRAKDAQFWFNQGYVNSLDELLAADERYSDFAAFQQGQVWNNNARVNANGGIDYYESGSANPDVVLADLIKILHPELLPDHELVYYRQLQ